MFVILGILLPGFVILSYYYICSNKYSVHNQKLPPGSVGWPVLGETYEFLSTGWKGYPEKFIFDRIHKFSSNVVKTSLFMEPAAVFAGAACNKFLFSNENKLVVAWWPDSVNKIFPSSTQTSSQVEAKKMRKMIPQFLKPEALRNYIGTMDSIAQRHFAMEWENKDNVLVFPLAKRYTFWLACRLFVSIDDPDHVAKFADPFELLASGIISIPINFPGTPFNKGIKASNFIRTELRAIIKQRKIDLGENRTSSANQDILSHMLLASDETGKHMNELDIADKILGLLIGGHDTASAACTFIVKYLAEFPHIYDQVLQGIYIYSSIHLYVISCVYHINIMSLIEITEQMEIARSKSEQGEELLTWDDIQKMRYSWNVACEVMRLAPPLQGAFREAITDFSFNGFSIPQGWKVRTHI